MKVQENAGSGEEKRGLFLWLVFHCARDIAGRDSTASRIGNLDSYKDPFGLVNVFDNRARSELPIGSEGNFT
jgi:hypothetical protein